MKRFLGALGALVLGTLPANAQEVYGFPAKDPAVQVTLPEGWAVAADGPDFAVLGRVDDLAVDPAQTVGVYLFFYDAEAMKRYRSLAPLAREITGADRSIAGGGTLEPVAGPADGRFRFRAEGRAADGTQVAFRYLWLRPQDAPQADLEAFLGAGKGPLVMAEVIGGAEVLKDEALAATAQALAESLRPAP